MRNKKLSKANERMLERQLKRGFSPCWYVVYHLNDGLISRHQQRRRLNPDEVSRDVGFHKHVLYQMVYDNRRWHKFARRARSLWSIEYGASTVKPHINMLTEALPGQWSEKERLQDLFSLHLPLKAKSVLFDSAFIQPVIPGTEGKVLRYICKETDERNVSMDYYATDWIL